MTIRGAADTSNQSASSCTCMASSCVKCFLQKSGEKLRTSFPWLTYSWSPTFKAGCTLCQAWAKEAGCASTRKRQFIDLGLTTVASLRPSRLQRHESQSEFHKKALEMHEHSGRQTSDVSSKHHPPQLEFQELVRVLREERKTLGRAGVSGIGWQKKCRQMLWCLAESSREQKRVLWTPRRLDKNFTVSCTIMQDARRNKLRLRYVAANSRMEIRSGYLCTVDMCDAGMDSSAIRKATVSALRQFATPKADIAYNTHHHPVGAIDESCQFFIRCGQLLNILTISRSNQSSPESD